jgi:hypothetical protein
MGQSTQARRGAPFAADLIHANYADRNIVLASGDVFTWGDAGSLGTRTFTQVDTSKDPNYGTFGSNPAVSFDDVNDFMVAPSVSLAVYGQITVAITASFVGSGSGMIMETSVNAGVSPGAFYIYENAGTYQVLFRNVAASRVRGAGITAGPKRLIVVFDVAGASAIPTLYVNGVSSGSAPGAADVSLGNYATYIGMRAGTSEPWGGKIGDNLVYGRALTVPEIAELDAWMAPRAA